MSCPPSAPPLRELEANQLWIVLQDPVLVFTRSMGYAKRLALTARVFLIDYIHQERSRFRPSRKHLVSQSRAYL
jgi:hypothetical protein